MQEYPKMLYGKKGWDALDDCRLVQDAAEEKAARKHGYAELPSLVEVAGEPATRPSDAA